MVLVQFNNCRLKNRVNEFAKFGANSKSIHKQINKHRNRLWNIKSFIVVRDYNIHYNKDKYSIRKLELLLRNEFIELIKIYIAKENNISVEQLDNITEFPIRAKNIMLNYCVANEKGKLLLTISGNGRIKTERYYSNNKKLVKALTKVFVSINYYTERREEKIKALWSMILKVLELKSKALNS